MRYVIYGISWVCLLSALVLKQLTTVSGAAYRTAPPALLACSVLLAAAGYIFTRKTTRKCPHCGERVARSRKVCEACSTNLGTIREDL